MKFKKLICLIFAVLVVLSGCAETEISENPAAFEEESFNTTGGEEYTFTAESENLFPGFSNKTEPSHKTNGQLNLVEIEDLHPSDRKEHEDEEGASSEFRIITLDDGDGDYDYVLNNNTMKFHEETCSSVKMIALHNKDYLDGSRETAIAAGYVPCKNCNP